MSTKEIKLDPSRAKVKPIQYKDGKMRVIIKFDKGETPAVQEFFKETMGSNPTISEADFCKILFFKGIELMQMELREYAKQAQEQLLNKETGQLEVDSKDLSSI